MSRSSPGALLIEDHVEWQDILGKELLRAGFRVDWAAGRDQALDHLREPRLDYRLVVLDPHLRDFADPDAGVVIASAIAQWRLPPRVIVVSGMLDSTASSRIFKPFGALIEGYFEKGSFARERDRFGSLLREISGSRSDDMEAPSRDE